MLPFVRDTISKYSLFGMVRRRGALVKERVKWGLGCLLIRKLWLEWSLFLSAFGKNVLFFIDGGQMHVDFWTFYICMDIEI